MYQARVSWQSHNDIYEQGPSNKHSVLFDPDTGRQYAVCLYRPYNDQANIRICRRGEGMKILYGIILVVLTLSLSNCASSKDTQQSDSDSPGVKISGDARVRAGGVYH